MRIPLRFPRCNIGAALQHVSLNPQCNVQYCWFRRAAAIAKRLGSAARHHVAASAFQTRPRLVQAGTKVDHRCRRHRRSNCREPKVPLWAPRRRSAENTVIYDILASEWAKTLILDPRPSCAILGLIFAKSKVKFGKDPLRPLLESIFRS